MPPQDPFDDIVKSYDSQAPKLPKPKPLATPSFDDIVNEHDQSTSSVPTKNLSPRKQATLRNITSLQGELTATSPQPKPGETVDVSSGEMYKPSQPFHSPKLDYKPEGIAPKPQSFNNRTQRAARTARQIENTKRQAVQLFQQADQTPDTPDATGISGRQKVRAQAEGKVEAANELARRAQKDYGDLLEIGFGKDTDPNSRRQWAYAKAKTPTARAARDTVDLQAANAERFANPRGQLNQALTPAPPQNYRQHLNVRAVPKPEESELSPEEQNALAARHQVAEEARQQIAAQNPGAVSRAILGAASVPVHALSGLASIPRRITGTAPGQLETSIGALGDVMASGAQPTPETQGTFSAGNLGTLAGFIPTMAVGGRILKPITPATPLGSAISSGAQFANIAGGEGVSNREMARQGLIGGGVGAASELAGGAANRALAGKLANAELTPTQAAVAGRGAQALAGGGAFAGQSALMGQRDPETLAKEALLGGVMGAVHGPRFREAQEAARQQGINDIRQQIDRRSAMNEAALRPQEVSQTVPAPMPARAASVPNAQEPTEALTGPLASATPPSAIPRLPAPENFNARRAKMLGMEAPPEVAINEQIQTADKLLNSPNEGDRRQGRALMNRALTALRQSEGYLNEATATEGEKPYTATRMAMEERLKPKQTENETPSQTANQVVNQQDSQKRTQNETVNSASGALRAEADAAKIKAAELEQSGDFAQAAATYQASHQNLKRLRRSMGQPKTPEAVAQINQIDREISIADANRRKAMQQARDVTRRANAPTAGLSKSEQNLGKVSPKSGQNISEPAPLLRPEAVQNPEGGIPQMPEQTFSGRLNRAIEQQRAQKPAAPEKRLITRIKELGGIDSRHVGEMQSLKDARNVGVIRNGAKMSPDILARQLQSEGYAVDPENLDTLWRAIDRDVAGKNERPLNTAELDRRLGEQEAEHHAKQEAAPDFDQIVSDVDSDTGALRRAIASSEERGHVMPEPGKGLVSMSPYADMVARNQKAVDRLYEHGMASPEGREVFRNLRDFAKREGIEPRHLHALADDVRNYEIEKAQWQDRGIDFSTVQSALDGLDAHMEASRKAIAEAPEAARTNAEREVAALDELFANPSDVNLLERAAAGEDNAANEFRNRATEYGISGETAADLIEARRPRESANRPRPAAENAQGESTARNRPAPQGEARSATPEEFDLLNRNPATIPKDEFDQHLTALEKLRNDEIRGIVKLSREDKREMFRQLRNVNEERKYRVQRKELPAKFEPRTFPIDKELMARSIEKATQPKTSEQRESQKADINQLAINAQLPEALQAQVDRVAKKDLATVHSIDITPAMKESVMQGQALFQKDAALPTVEHVLSEAKIQFKPGKRGQAGTLYADENALHIIRAAHDEVFQGQSTFNNININREASRRMAIELNKAANDPDFDRVTQRKLREIAREFNYAAQSGETVSIVKTGGERKFSDIKVSRRHELFHDAQEGLENSKGFLANHKYGNQLIEGLSHYSFEDRTVEAAAFIAGGQAKEFGLTDAQGKEFLKDYFDDIVATNGREALERFVSMAPQVQDALKEARQQHGVQRQTENDISRTAERQPSRTIRAVEQPTGRSQEVPRTIREQKRIRASFGSLENEPRGQIAASGLGGLQNLFNRKPTAAKPAQATPLPKNWNLANWSQRFYREAMAAGLSKADRAKFDAAKTPRDKNAVLMGATIDPKHEQAVFDVIDKADNATTAKDGSALYDAMVEATNMLRHKPAARGYERLKQEAANATSLPRALQASSDISAMLRQGAMLTLPPMQWGKAAKATVRMFESFSTKQYDRISKEINLHPDAETARDSGLYLSTDKSGLVTKKEEDFISNWADKIPIVKHSEQAYKAYLDSLRMDTFARYKKSIDKTKGLSQEQKENGYKAAADWINVATGRGTLGKTFEDAMPILSKVMFAPRYTASRIQVLNPMTYAKNMRTAEGRVVLKNQMSDLVQYAGVISATLALAQANGAQVGLNPDDPDFLKIKIGNTRYDTLAGLQQPMRLFYRMGKSLYGRATGQKVDSRESALDIASRFGRSKLAPIPSFFVDYFSGKDFTGQPFSAPRAVVERAVPLMWKDFYDAYQTEGLPGGLKILPGATGIGVQNYSTKPTTLKSSGFTKAAAERGLNFESLRPKANEPDDVFNARKQRVEGWMNEYGDKLINSPRYSLLTEEQKKAAIKLLRDRIGRQQNLKSPKLATFEPNAVLLGIKKSAENKPKQARKQLWTPTTP